MTGSTTTLLRRLRRHRVPAWWSDAKLGIFVHWTPASVPAFAPTDIEIGDLLAARRPDAMASSPYSEWYENSLRFPASPASEHHRATYGSKPYREFAGDYEAGLDSWDPDGWARRFAGTGARYVVLVTKHHDGYCLWPSGVRNPHIAGWHTRRDVVGELAEAVRGAGLRFGVYYSGGLDWTFDDTPIGTVSDLVAALPRGSYPDYAEAQVRELISRYRPSVLWNDISWPTGSARLYRLFTDYYSAVPDGVVNDRWLAWSPALAAARLAPVKRVIDEGAARSARAHKGLVPPKPPHFDVQTPEYATFPDIRRRAWECVRGIDKSFGFNRASDESKFIPHDELLHTTADIASKGGNLLLNVGPRGEDAAIPAEQARRLDWLAGWTATNGEGLFETRPWVRAADTTPEGPQVRYTARGTHVFATVLLGAGDAEGLQTLTLPSVRSAPATSVSVLGHGEVAFSDTGSGMRVDLAGVVLDQCAPVIDIAAADAADSGAR